MDKIYHVWLSQTFDVYVKHWWNRNKKLYKTDCKSTSNGIFVLAKDEDEAILKYDKRHNVNNIDKIISQYWIVREFGLFAPAKKSLHIEPCNFRNKIFAIEMQNFELDTLKINMHADDFLEYCRQRLYPVSEIIGSS